VKSEQDVKSQVGAIRERVKELSGFYIAEGAAMTYALEWVLEKRETAPAGELGSAGRDSQKIAESLAAAAEKASAAATKSARAPKPPPKKSKEK
jgi:hypothetical protein